MWGPGYTVSWGAWGSIIVSSEGIWDWQAQGISHWSRGRAGSLRPSRTDQLCYLQGRLAEAQLKIQQLKPSSAVCCRMFCMKVARLNEPFSLDWQGRSCIHRTAVETRAKCKKYLVAFFFFCKYSLCHIIFLQRAEALQLQLDNVKKSAGPLLAELTWMWLIHDSFCRSSVQA